MFNRTAPVISFSTFFRNSYNLVCGASSVQIDILHINFRCFVIFYDLFKSIICIHFTTGDNSLVGLLFWVILRFFSSLVIKVTLYFIETIRRKCFCENCLNFQQIRLILCDRKGQHPTIISN